MDQHDELSNLVGDSKSFIFKDSLNLTMFKEHIIAYSYQDGTNTTYQNSKLFLYFKSSPTKYLELYYSKNKYNDFLDDKNLLKKHFDI